MSITSFWTLRLSSNDLFRPLEVTKAFVDAQAAASAKEAKEGDESVNKGKAVENKFKTLAKYLYV